MPLNKTNNPTFAGLKIFDFGETQSKASDFFNCQRFTRHKVLSNFLVKQTLHFGVQPFPARTLLPVDAILCPSFDVFYWHSKLGTQLTDGCGVRPIQLHHSLLYFPRIVPIRSAHILPLFPFFLSFQTDFQFLVFHKNVIYLIRFFHLIH